MEAHRSTTAFDCVQVAHLRHLLLRFSHLSAGYKLIALVAHFVELVFHFMRLSYKFFCLSLGLQVQFHVLGFFLIEIDFSSSDLRATSS